MQEQHVGLLVLPDKVLANISSIYLLIQECRIHVYRWGTDWEESDHEWWLANGINSLTWAPHHCRQAMVLFTFPKFQHGREVYSPQMNWTRNCEIRTSSKKHQFLKPRAPDPLLKTSWQLILINEWRYMQKKWARWSSSQFIHIGKAYSSPSWCRSHQGLNPRVARHISLIPEQPEATLACTPNIRHAQMLPTIVKSLDCWIKT